MQSIFNILLVAFVFWKYGFMREMLASRRLWYCVNQSSNTPLHLKRKKMTSFCKQYEISVLKFVASIITLTRLVVAQLKNKKL